MRACKKPLEDRKVCGIARVGDIVQDEDPHMVFEIVTRSQQALVHPRRSIAAEAHRPIERGEPMPDRKRRLISSVMNGAAAPAPLSAADLRALID